MLIIAGHLLVAADERQRYLDAVSGVAELARRQPGCLDFVQAADTIDPTRINIFERWDSDADLERFRTSGDREDEDGGYPDLIGADVAKYRVASVEAP